MTTILQLKSESAKAYAALIAYAQLGTDRSLEKVAQRCSKSVSLMRRWSVAHSWASRVRAYDAQLAEAAMEAHRAQYLAELEAYRQRTKAMGASLYTVAWHLLRRLQAQIDTVEITANTLSICARAIVVAADLEAHALMVDQLLRQFDDTQ